MVRVDDALLGIDDRLVDERAPLVGAWLQRIRQICASVLGEAPYPGPPLDTVPRVAVHPTLYEWAGGGDAFAG